MNGVRSLSPAHTRSPMWVIDTFLGGLVGGMLENEQGQTRGAGGVKTRESLANITFE